MLNDSLYITILESITSKFEPILDTKFEDINIKDSEFAKIFQINFVDSENVLGKEDICIYIPKVDINIYKDVYQYTYYFEYKNFLEIPYLDLNGDKLFKIYDFTPIVNIIKNINGYKDSLSIEIKTALLVSFLMAHEFGHALDYLLNNGEFCCNDVSPDLLCLFKRFPHLDNYDVRSKCEQAFIKIEIEDKKNKLNFDKESEKISHNEYFNEISRLDNLYRNLCGESIADEYAVNILNAIDIIEILTSIS